MIEGNEERQNHNSLEDRNMPFYDLYCAGCDKEYNIMATMADKSERRIKCPECGSTQLETVYNAAPAYIKSTRDSMPACPNSRACGAVCPHTRSH